MDFQDIIKTAGDDFRTCGALFLGGQTPADWEAKAERMGFEICTGWERGERASHLVLVCDLTDSEAKAETLQHLGNVWNRSGLVWLVSSYALPEKVETIQDNVAQYGAVAELVSESPQVFVVRQDTRLHCSHRGKFLESLPCRPCQGREFSTLWECRLHGKCQMTPGTNKQAEHFCNLCDDLPEAIRPPGECLITVGIPVFQDFDGLWATIVGNRELHEEFLTGRAEFLVVDNDPGGDWRKKINEFCTNANTEQIPIRQHLLSGEPSPAKAKDAAVRFARGQYVLVLDSHVILRRDSIARTLDWLREQGPVDDLVQGPLSFDNGREEFTHQEARWGGLALGQWEQDKRPAGTNRGQPFQIPQQGTGLFLVRRESWLGFCDHWRTFGGEEQYLHQKYIRAGRRVWCLPWLRWFHRFDFNKPTPRPYPLNDRDRAWNFITGRLELGLPVDDVYAHFVQETEAFSGAEFSELIQAAREL